MPICPFPIQTKTLWKQILSYICQKKQINYQKKGKQIRAATNNKFA